jgi:hypothetical protein
MSMEGSSNFREKTDQWEIKCGDYQQEAFRKSEVTCSNVKQTDIFSHFVSCGSSTLLFHENYVCAIMVKGVVSMFHSVWEQRGRMSQRKPDELKSEEQFWPWDYKAHGLTQNLETININLENIQIW